MGFIVQNKAACANFEWIIVNEYVCVAEPVHRKAQVLYTGYQVASNPKQHFQIVRQYILT